MASNGSSFLSGDVHKLIEAKKPTKSRKFVEARRLIKTLQKNRRQLLLSNVPVRITAEFLRQTAVNFNKLETIADNNDEVATLVASESKATRTVVRTVLKRLDIQNPIYALPDEMARYAGLCRKEMLRRLTACMTRNNIPAANRRRWTGFLAKLLEGNEVADCTEDHERMLIGLLHGTSKQELLDRCPKGRKHSFGFLLKLIQYNGLKHEVGSKVQMKKLGVPQFFVKQTYKQHAGLVASRTVGQPVANEPFINLDQEGENAVQEEAREVTDHEEAEDGGVERGGFMRFVRMFDKRLPKDQIPDGQRKRMVKMVQAGLQNRPYKRTDYVEHVFVDGIIAGHDQETMFQQCTTRGQNAALARILDVVDLEGLRIGYDWTYDAEGNLSETHRTHPGNVYRHSKSRATGLSHLQVSNLQPQVVPPDAGGNGDVKAFFDSVPSLEDSDSGDKDYLPKSEVSGRVTTSSAEAFAILEDWKRRLVYQSPY